MFNNSLSNLVSSVQKTQDLAYTILSGEREREREREREFIQMDNSIYAITQ